VNADQAQRQVIQRLFALFKVLGLSQRDVAELMNITDSNISQWKSGYRFPSEGQIERLRAILANAMRMDVIHETERVSAIDTRDQRTRHRQHVQKLREAMRRYQAAMELWVQAMRAGANRMSLLEEERQLSGTIRRYLDRQEQGWSEHDRSLVMGYLERLQETLRLLNLLDKGEMPGD
jgi:transcriptional regulator with XRE-family HTH domain